MTDIAGQLAIIHRHIRNASETWGQSLHHRTEAEAAPKTSIAVATGAQALRLSSGEPSSAAAAVQEKMPNPISPRDKLMKLSDTLRATAVQEIHQACKHLDLVMEAMDSQGVLKELEALGLVSFPGRPPSGPNGSDSPSQPPAPRPG